MSTHLCLFSIVGEVVQVEGAVHGVVVHLQQARLITLFVKQESSSVGWATISQPRASVLRPLKAAQSGLKLKVSSLFRARSYFYFPNKRGSALLLLLPRKTGTCAFTAVVNWVNGEQQLPKCAEPPKELLGGANFTSGS